MLYVQYFLINFLFSMLLKLFKYMFTSLWSQFNIEVCYCASLLKFIFNDITLEAGYHCAGNRYTIEISKCYKLRERVVKYLPKHY